MTLTQWFRSYFFNPLTRALRSGRQQVPVLMIVLIIPLQRWILERRRYTTITGSFRPGLIDLGKWNYIAFAILAALLSLLTVGPMVILVLGSFMQRIGYFVLGFTLDHWRLVLTDPVFVKALRTTLTLALTAADAQTGEAAWIGAVVLTSTDPAIPAGTNFVVECQDWGEGANAVNDRTSDIMIVDDAWEAFTMPDLFLYGWSGGNVQMHVGK